MDKIVNHQINNNSARILNNNYVGIELARVVVGVKNPDRKEILQDPESGYNYSRDAVEGQEVYNYSTQKKRA